MEQQFNPYTTPPEGGMPQDFHTNGTSSFRQITKPNAFELAAFSLAIASVFASTTVYFSYILGGLAILFALLSRGAQMKFSPRAKWSIMIAIAGIILATVLFFSAIYMLLEEYGSFEEILRYYSDLAGVDFEKEFGMLFE